jgi:hypothetical protein
VIGLKRFLNKLRKKKKEEEPETWKPEPETEPTVVSEPIEKVPPLETATWGKDSGIIFKHGSRIRFFRFLAIIYVFLNIIIGVLFASNSLLINVVVFLYLAPNTIILLHYLKLIREKK